ncbi:HNH endonuclease [Paenibacillus endoradicis]|uniref:HNH endonuclease n=1 Tax=Paenibacillus endoradicis TaxID=2972487 RepID=UPI0021595AAC|nr:hypothetical protein [Paenibacillus endoradicis]MCR8659176.1 hypothetical protein [Paenibacillus endoradicis]
MINLNPPQHIGISLYDDITSKKNNDRKNRLGNLRSLVNQRYTEYLTKIYNLHEIIPLSHLSDEEKIDLQSCYSNNVELNKKEIIIKKMQTISMQAVCPYCGISEPDTLDHYLPKGTFPEFSVLSINLIPSCGTCNRNKGEKWLEGETRRIINFYYDQLPNEKVLNIHIEYVQESDIPVISFSLSNEVGITESFFNTIEFHYRDLHLFERFSKQVSDKFTGIYLELLEGVSVLSIEEQKDNIQRRINSLTKRYGLNHWEVCLYEAVLNSDFFFNRIYQRN